MSSLQRVQIGKYIEILTDYHSNGSYESLRDNVKLLSKKDYAIMVRTLNFERDDFSTDLIYVNKSAYEHLSKSKVLPDDILTNKIANPGSIYIMPDLHYPVTCGMNLFLIRFSKEVNQRYMYYCMKNSEAYIKSFAHGTTTKTITKDEVRSIDLLIHTDIEEQNRIERLLSAIDKKIENNNAINDNLQQVIKSCFDFMFATRKPNGIISDILQEHPKSTIQVNDSTGVLGDYPFFTSGEAINEWQSALVDGMNCYLSTGGNATIKGYYGKAAYSTDTWCVCGKGEYSFYLFCYLKSIIRSINDSFFAGSGLKHLQKDSLLLVNLYIPSEKELGKFNSIVKPAMETMTTLFLETKKLKQQRDFILPLLMNGQANIAE